jgi:hypothetical protein
MTNEQKLRALAVGYPDEFGRYWDVFVRAGKPLSKADVQNAYARWSGLAPEDWAGALADAERECRSQADPRWIPEPVNHLRKEGWTRIAAERTLPVDVPQKARGKSFAELETERVRAEILGME